MSFASGQLKRASRLDRRKWLLLVRASLALAGARLLLSRRSFPEALRFGAVPVGSLTGETDGMMIIWAVRAAARRVPFRAMCIEQGIAAQRLLRHAGIDALLHYGARPGGDGKPLSAHVWVSVKGEILIGGAEADKFAEIGAFP